MKEDTVTEQPDSMAKAELWDLMANAAATVTALLPPDAICLILVKHSRGVGMGVHTGSGNPRDLISCLREAADLMEASEDMAR